MPGCNSGKYLSLDPNVFRNVQNVKFEGHTLLPSLELKNRKAVLSSLPVIDMLKHLNVRTRSLLENWDKPLLWDSTVGLLETSEESASDSPNLPLSETITKDQLRDELRLRTWGADAAVGLLDHQTKILIAQSAEIKIMLRTLLMEKFDHSSNQRLSEALAKSRLSSPGLFGKIPESFAHKLEQAQPFPSFKAPEVVLFSGPPNGKSKKFQGVPSGSRGVSSTGKSKKKSSSTLKNWSSGGGNSQLLHSENIQYAGGHAKTSRGSTRTTRGKASTRGSKSRGGRGARGGGRGKYKK